MKKRLVEVALELIASKQVAKEIAKPITVEVLPEVKLKPEQPIGGTITTPMTISKVNKLIHQTGSGILEEIKIATDSPDYRIGIWVDDEYLYKDTYSNLQTVAPYYEGIDAYEEDGTYYLALINIPFTYLLEVWLEPTGTSITLNHLAWRGRLK